MTTKGRDARDRLPHAALAQFAVTRGPAPRAEPIVFVWLDAGRCRNGNPRRCFLVLDAEGFIVDAIDEGYEGREAVMAKYPAVKEGPRLVVPARTRRALLSRHAAWRVRQTRESYG